MDLFELIKTRRAVFPAQYDGTAVPKADLTKMLEAANWAPSHKKTEPWRFKVLQGNALVRLGEFLAEVYVQTTLENKYSTFKENKIRKNPTLAGAVIAICMQRDPKERVPEWEEIAATAMAVQNMWLMAHHLGLGSYWSSPKLIEYMDRFFDFEQGERCLGFFYIGYPSTQEPVEAKRNPITEKTTWIS